MRANIFEINGVWYHSDRPKNCQMCYFWKNRKTGCILGLKNCYYLVKAKKETGHCADCPYTVGRPCVSMTCYRDLMEDREHGKRKR